MSKLEFREFHKRNLPHFQFAGQTYFLTTCVKRDWRTGKTVIDPLQLDHDCIARKLRCLLMHFDTVLYQLHAYVIMPDHIHMLLSPECNGNEAVSLSKIMHCIKQLSARRINRYLNRHGSVWQAEYYDRQIRSIEDYRQTLRYMYLNPVAADLIDKASDWPWWYFRNTDSITPTG